MCVEWTGKWKKLKRDVIAYKAVRRFHFSDVSLAAQPFYTSLVWPGARNPQTRRGRSGVLTVYVPGHRLKSPKPGIYLFRNLKDAIDDCGDSFILRVTIPAGTEVRLGHSGRLTKTINAREIVVGDVVYSPKEK